MQIHLRLLSWAEYQIESERKGSSWDRQIDDIIGELRREKDWRQTWYPSEPCDWVPCWHMLKAEPLTSFKYQPVNTLSKIMK